MTLQRWYQYRGTWQPHDSGRWVRFEDAFAEVRLLEAEIQSLRSKHAEAQAAAVNAIRESQQRREEIERLRQSIRDTCDLRISFDDLCRIAEEERRV